MQTQENFSILLVDDDPMVIRVLSHILNPFAPLRYATSGRIALKLARESAPDLVLLDIDMPVFSGFDTCREFKADPTLKEIPIIFISAHESAQLEIKGLELGAVDYIRKPPNPGVVLSRVRMYQQIKQLSDTLRSGVTMDFLTGTLKRRQCEKAILQEWLRAERSGEPLVLLLIDIDQFSSYNSEVGEAQGDVCLKAIADALRPIARRPTDVFARWAGGQFAWLLPDTHLLGAKSLAKRAVEAVDALQIPHVSARQPRKRLTVSVGGGYRTARSAVASRFIDNSATAVTSPALDQSLVAAAEQAVAHTRESGGHITCFIEIHGKHATSAMS